MGTYWNYTGKYQARYDQIAELVPTSGKADTIYIDLLRNISNLYADHYNNAGCNWDHLQDQFFHIRYYTDELQSVDNHFDFRSLLGQFESIYNEVWIDAIEDENEDLIWQASEALEFITDVIICYAWGKEHSLQSPESV